MVFKNWNTNIHIYSSFVHESHFMNIFMNKIMNQSWIYHEYSWRVHKSSLSYEFHLAGVAPTRIVPCRDQLTNCDEYSSDVCVNPLYRLWREDNCRKYCGICSGKKWLDWPSVPPPPPVKIAVILTIFPCLYT